MEAWSPWFVQFAFVLGSLRIVAFDHADLEVPLAWLLGLFVVPCLILLWVPEAWPSMAALSTVILVVGMLLLRLLPDRLGEADVLFVSVFPFVLGPLSLVFALGLACVGGLAWASWGLLRNQSRLDLPLPFTPLLLWGGLTQMPWGRFA